MARSILIVGASGLVGQGILKTALQDGALARIVLLVRRPIAVSDARVQQIQLADFSEAALRGADLHGLDACFYAAGPLPLGMGEAAYRAVTVDATARVARAFAAANPGGRFFYISGAGANAASRLMPMKVKGEAEDALRGLGLACCALRPGIVRPVLGEVSPHRLRRGAYGLGAPVMALFARLVPSQFTSTQAIGRALLRLLDADPLPAVLENARINALGA